MFGCTWRFILSGILATLLAILVARVLEQRYFKEYRHHELVIGILSAQTHSLRRDIIRRHLKRSFNLSRIQVVFIVGKHACEIPEEDRIDVFECLPNPNIQSLEETYMSQSVDDGQKDGKVDIGNIKVFGYDFKVDHDIMVDALGVHKSFLIYQQQFAVSIRLYDTIKQEVIVSASFVPFSKGHEENQYFIKDVKSIILPKGFRGTIAVTGYSLEHNCQLNVTFAMDENYLIQLAQGYRYGYNAGEFPAYLNNHVRSLFAGAVFKYRVHVNDSLLKINKTELYKQYRRKIFNDQIQLRKEEEDFNDLVLVDVTETYRNIPEKMLHFYKWTSTQNFDFVMKTDDDCYFNISAIKEIIDAVKMFGKNDLWIGNFREYFGLDLYGKWAEQNYKSASYPPFACGSGFLLSANLVRWIAWNKNYLRTFQGEDTSLGIWLSGIKHKRIHDNRFSCSKDVCENNEFLTIPELTITEMEMLFQNNSVNKVLCDE